MSNRNCKMKDPDTRCNISCNICHISRSIFHSCFYSCMRNIFRKRTTFLSLQDMFRQKRLSSPVTKLCSDLNDANLNARNNFRGGHTIQFSHCENIGRNVAPCVQVLKSKDSDSALSQLMGTIIIA